MPQLLHHLTIGANKLDIGLYLNSYVDDKIRLKLAKDPWVPPKTYDFKKYLINESISYRMVCTLSMPKLLSCI